MNVAAYCKLFVIVQFKVKVNIYIP